MNKLKVTEAQKAEIEQQKEDLQGQISQLEKEKEIQRKLSESDKKRYEESIRERDVLTKMKAQVNSYGHPRRRYVSPAFEACSFEQAFERVDKIEI